MAKKKPKTTSGKLRGLPEIEEPVVESKPVPKEPSKNTVWHYFRGFGKNIVEISEGKNITIFFKNGIFSTQNEELAEMLVAKGFEKVQ